MHCAACRSGCKGSKFWQPSWSRLRSPEAAPLVAYLTSMCLTTAALEVKAGLKGSKALRGASLHALRLLLEAVADGDVLAPLLPGLASGLSNALLAASGAGEPGSGRPVGAAAGSQAAAEALRGLAAVLSSTLGDMQARELLVPSLQGSSNTSTSALDALSMLQQLASGQPEDTAAAPPSPGCIKLLDSGLPALDHSAGMLLDVLLTLAQDEWGQVSGPCKTWLQQQADPSEAGPQACKSSQLTAEVLQNPVQLQVILLELTQGLAFDPAAAALLLHHTSTGGAHLPQALPATEQGSAAAPRAAEAPGCCAPAESSRRGNALALSAAVAGPVDRQPGSAQEPRLDPTLPTQHALPEGLQLPAVELPRMPGGLKFIATGKAYEAAAKVARVLGHAAAGSGGPADKGAQVYALISRLLQLLQSALPFDVSQQAATAAGTCSPADALRYWQMRPLQVGVNAMLVRSCLEAVGTLARALQGGLTSNGRLLRAVLLPVLERLSDPCASVASSAAAAISSLCFHGGYATFGQLVAANADYIVDGLCKQLRRLSDHPMAPHLFAALLQEADVAPHLLPLLAEPVQSAFHGLSILNRGSKPHLVVAFLQALAEIVKACVQEAAKTCMATQAAADRIASAVRERWPQKGDDLQAALEMDQEPADIEDIRQYFDQHHMDKAQAEQEPGDDPKIKLPDEDTAAVDDLRRRIHAAAILAAAAADVSSPLLAAADTRAALLAVEVCVWGLSALQNTTAALDLFEQVITPHLKREDAIRPVEPDTPKMLPSVHVMWGFLVTALQDTRTAVLLRALEVLPQITQMASGQFMLRRIQQEAWPVMKRLLQADPLQRHSRPVPGQHFEATAPAMVQRIRVAALECIRSIAASNDSQVAFKGLTGELAAAAGRLLVGPRETAACNEAAQLSGCNTF
eukprot:jgi/Astpho2/2860/fgenesh1_pg.00050_%23_118_t